MIIRRMSVDDIPQVVEIDKSSFSLPWTERSFRYEVTENIASRCWVVEAENREVAAMLLGEQLVLVLVAIPVGFAVGAGICAMLVMALDAQETMRLPLVFSGRTFAFAFVIVATAAMLSAFAIWRRLRGLDLIAVLKTRE